MNEMIVSMTALTVGFMNAIASTSGWRYISTMCRYVQAVGVEKKRLHVTRPRYFRYSILLCQSVTTETGSI